MLTLLGSTRRCCDGITRRESLQAGGLAFLGGVFGLPRLLQASSESARPKPRGKARSVIVLYLLGGAATQDMVDMKPAAPSGIRSDFKPMATRVTGIQVCEHLPRLAGWMHRTAIVRSVNHKAGCHNLLPSMTGYGEPVPGSVVRDTFPPSMGSVCEYLKQKESGDFPAYVHLPCYPSWGTAYRYPGPYAGFLGRRYDPLFTDCTAFVDGGPDKPYYPKVLHGKPYLPSSVLPRGITLDRLAKRRTLTQQFDDQLRGIEDQEFDRAQGRAFSLLTSRRVKKAFDVDSVDPKVRDRYGPTLFGTSALIARKLVAEGVRFVNVTWELFGTRLKINHDGWDTHQRNFAILKEYNLPYFDLAFDGLMHDLDDSGLLDETLVVVMSDMGRTPQVNKNQAGRDHWTFCYSVMLAGAGIRGGTVYGASDAQAAYVKEKPVSPADICATIYQCLGIDPAMPVHDASGRPFPVAQGGRAIKEILA